MLAEAQQARDPGRKRLERQGMRRCWFHQGESLAQDTLSGFPTCFYARPNYAGDIGIGINPKLAQRVKEADLLLVVGARLGEIAHRRLHPAVRRGRRRSSSMCTPAPEDSEGTVQGDLLINSGMPPIARRAPASAAPGAKRHVCACGLPRMDQPPGDQAGHQSISSSSGSTTPSSPTARKLLGWLQQLYPPSAIFRTQLAPTRRRDGLRASSHHAKIVQPQRTVVSWNGDRV